MIGSSSHYSGNSEYRTLSSQWTAFITHPWLCSWWCCLALPVECGSGTAPDQGLIASICLSRSSCPKDLIPGSCCPSGRSPAQDTWSRSAHINLQPEGDPAQETCRPGSLTVNAYCGVPLRFYGDIL